ncbi:hypothetical protein [Sphingobacterium sp. UBA6645]|uniref:hypothetical protein n=1 Tax=Sphingobacterium sp. UBA6645 TaxID=1947511 RepID=UPI0025D562B5|nr:hypothetical protein [Sphingobacterium sp. UBA6645]
MSKQEKLSEKGYIFGLGAFRRYKEITGHDISHFDESLLNKVDHVEGNYRWAVMLKCANDVYCNTKGGEQISVDEFTILLDSADQEESNKLVSQYLDSCYMGKSMREYYGIPKPDEKSKKKPSQRAKPTSRR